jgi:hypothetical protein
MHTFGRHDRPLLGARHVGVPVVSQTTLSVFTIGSVSGDAQNLNFAVPVEWIKELPQRHERLNAKAAASGAASAASR